MTKAPASLVSPSSSMRDGSSLPHTSLLMAFSSWGDPSEVSSPAKVLTATSLPFQGTLRVTPPAPFPKMGQDSSSRTGSSRIGSFAVSVMLSKKGFPAKAAQRRLGQASKSSKGGSVSWLQASRMSSRFWSFDQISNFGSSVSKFPDSMNFCILVHRPKVSGSLEILLPVKMSHRIWGCRASGWMDVMVWHSLKETIWRFLHCPITGGTSTNLFLGQNKMLRAGKISGNEDGSSVKPRLGRSSLVNADRSIVVGLEGMFSRSHCRCSDSSWDCSGMVIIFF
mmetsp:Transcript_22594/g.55978  ORF Transcript_22594/g.55978 Transcript_22594/m.55978 type:complete len:281 (-) Transcript_22594:23-865(-)